MGSKLILSPHETQARASYFGAELCQNIKTVYGVADEVEPCSWCKLLKESEGLNAVGNECLALQLRETLVLHDLLRTKRNTNIKIVEGVAWPRRSQPTD